MTVLPKLTRQANLVSFGSASNVKSLLEVEVELLTFDQLAEQSEIAPLFAVEA